METEHYLRIVDHALLNLTDNGDLLRRSEINNIRQCVKSAIESFEMGELDAEVFAQTVIEEFRGRIDAIFADITTAGNHEQFRDTIPSPPIE